MRGKRTDRFSFTEVTQFGLFRLDRPQRWNRLNVFVRI